MNTYLMKALKERVNNQYKVISDDIGTYIRFLAKSTDFGDIVIYEETELKDSYMVEVGNLTHLHLNMCNESASESVEFITNFLENLFADKLICYNNGYFDINDYNRLSEVDCDLFVWSGIYRRAEKD